MLPVNQQDPRVHYEELHLSLLNQERNISDLDTDEAFGLTKWVIIHEPYSICLTPLRQRITKAQKEAIRLLEQSFQTPSPKKARVITPQDSNFVRVRFRIDPDDPIRKELFAEENPETEISSLKIALMFAGAAAIYCVVIHPFLKKRLTILFKGVGEKSSPAL